MLLYIFLFVNNSLKVLIEKPNKTVTCYSFYVPPVALRLARRAAQRRSSPALPRLQLHCVIAAGRGGFRGACQAAAAPGGPGQTPAGDTFPLLAPCRRVSGGVAFRVLVQLLFPLCPCSSCTGRTCCSATATC